MGIQVRDGSNLITVEWLWRWSDSGDIWKLEPVVSVSGLDVECDGNRGIHDDSQILVLNVWVTELFFIKMEKSGQKQALLMSNHKF